MRTFRVIFAKHTDYVGASMACVPATVIRQKDDLGIEADSFDLIGDRVTFFTGKRVTHYLTDVDSVFEVPAPKRSRK